MNTTSHVKPVIELLHLAPDSRPTHSESQRAGLEPIVRRDVLGGLIHEYDLVA